MRPRGGAHRHYRAFAIDHDIRQANATFIADVGRFGSSGPLLCLTDISSESYSCRPIADWCFVSRIDAYTTSDVAMTAVR